MHADPAILQDANLSLTSLAEWVRGLPVASLAPVGLLFVAGLLLLAFGQRLLKPVLVLAAIFCGVILAARVGQSIQPSISPLVWSAIGAVAGLITAVLSYRLVLGLAVGVIGAAVAMLLALTAAQLGWIDAGAGPPPPVRAEGIRPLVDDPLVAAALIVQNAADGTPATNEPSALSKQLDGVSPGLGPTVVAWLDHLNGLLSSVGQWADERWGAMPKPLRTLLMASGAAGGFLGFATGLACPTWAAATLTSLFGSLLVLICGAPLLSRVVSADSLPEVRPLGWLCLWLGIALAGLIFQSVTRPKKEPPKREPVPDER